MVNGGGGDNWSYDMQSSSHIVTINKPKPNFLQARCPSCQPTNSVKALKGRSIIIGHQHNKQVHTNTLVASDYSADSTHNSSTHFPPLTAIP